MPTFIFLRILSLSPPILNVSRNPGSGGVLASKLIWFQLKLLAPATVITSQFISISPKVSSSASQILQNASSTIPSLWSCTLRVKYPVRNHFSKLRLVLQMLQTNHAQNTIFQILYPSWLRYFVYNLSISQKLTGSSTSIIVCLWRFCSITVMTEQSHKTLRWGLDMFYLVVYNRWSVIFLLSESLSFCFIFTYRSLLWLYNVRIFVWKSTTKQINPWQNLVQEFAATK